MWPFPDKTSQPAQQQKPAGTQDPNASGTPDPNSGGQQEPPQGLDKFAHLLDNASNKGDGGGDNSATKQPTDVAELFKNGDFTKGLRDNLRANLNSAITPETQALIEANDPKAMLAMMQDVAEASYMQALQHSASLQNLVMTEKLDGLDAKTGELVDSKLQSQEFTQAMPQLKNPIVKLGVEAFMSKVREQNPSISAQDMKDQVTEYVGELGKDLGAVPQDSSNQEPTQDVDKGVDWFEELGIQPPPDNS